MGKNFKILLLILLLGITFRIWNLETIPHWYWDEGVNMNIAWNLANGKMQWFCLSYPFVPHPPLFFIIAAFTLKLLGNELLVLRGLSVFYGILTILLLYLIGKEMFNKKIGLLSAFLFAIYPTAIYWNRMGFANNQLMFLSVLTLYSTLLYLNRKDEKWFYLAGILTGLSIITEILGIGLFFAASILLWIYRKEKLLNFIVISTVIPSIFVVSMLILMPDAFIHDLTHNSGRVNYILIFSFSVILFLVYSSRFRRIFFGYIHDTYVIFIPSRLREINTRLYKNCVSYLYEIYRSVIEEMKENLPVFYIIPSLIIFFMPPSDKLFVDNLDYFWLGILGFYFIKEKKSRDILFCFFLSFFIILWGLDRSDHMIIPLYPLFCIGLAFFLDLIYGISLGYFREKLWGINLNVTALTVLLVFYPLGVFVYYDTAAFVNGEFLSIEDIDARYKVADFVNERVVGDDVVLTDSHLSRMINSKTSVLIQAAAFKEESIAYMPSDLSKDRFLFNCSHRNAKFIVMVNGTREWAMNHTALVKIMNEIQNWSTNEINNYLIYRNPHID